VIFVGIWVGSKIGKNLTEPLQYLVIATQKLSKKEFHLEEELFKTMTEDEIGQLIASFKEMTEKLKAYEEELKSYNAYLNSLLNHLPVGILILSTNFEVKYSNNWLKEFLRLFNFKEEKEFLEFLGLSTVLNSVSLDAPFYKTYEFVKEEKAGIVGITVIKLVSYKESELMIVVENLEEKERLKRLSLWREVAARIAHEIKNPLTPIKLSVERLRKQLEKDLPEDKKRVLKKTTSTIEKYIEELKSLAVDFYYFSRKSSLSLKKVNLFDNLREVLSLYEMAYPEVKFELKVVGDVECLVDEAQLKRIWINLFDNSVKAMQGKGKVEVFLAREGKSVVIEVADTGPGIPEEIVEKVEKGEVFKLKEFGTGLLMVYSIVEMHKGVFRIEKNYPKGTRFVITLPCET